MTDVPGHSDAPDRPEPVRPPEPATVPLSAAPPPPAVPLSAAPPPPPAPPPAPPSRRTPWYRRLPGHLGLWVAALALVGACVIGCGGFVAGVVVSHGFGGGRGVSRDAHWGPRQQPGGRFRDGQHGPGWQRGPRRRTAPAPQPSASPPPAQPSAPSPAASPTA